jgi:membrane dipeptidase
MADEADRSSTKETEAERLHREALILDMVAPLVVDVFPQGAEDYLAGGVAAVGATVLDPLSPESPLEGCLQGFRGVAHIRALVDSIPEKLLLVESVGDLHRAKRSNKLGVIIHFQDCTQFERTVGLVEPFYRSGARVAQLTYNVRNLVADGCIERLDGGLSKFGVRLVKEMNRVGMVVDGSHTGQRSTLDAMEVSEAPFIFSHSGSKAIYDHPRNITDEQIRECAQTGGVVGIHGAPFILGNVENPTIQDVIHHIAHVSELVGTDHVGIGLDYHAGISPYSASDADARKAMFQSSDEDDLWNPGDIPPPPWTYASEIKTPAHMRNLTAGLLASGFSYDDTRKVMGANFVRVFERVWKPGGRPSE